MSGDNRIPKGISKIVRLFPRLPEPEKVADLAQQVWKTPQFSANVRGGMTHFIFSIPIQSAFKVKSPLTYRALFKAKRTTWKDALEEAYPEAQIGTKSAKSYIDSALYAIFRDALQILNTDTDGLQGGYTIFKKDFVANFKQATPRAGGRSIDGDKEKRAIRLFKRHKILSPKVQDLRKFIDGLKRSGMNDEEILRRNVAAEFRDDWISLVTSGAAFETILGDSTQGGIIRGTTIGGKWAPWQLTISIIRCEAAGLNPRKCPSLITIFRSIMLGTKLEKASRLRKK